jgi:hypothetical protein
MRILRAIVSILVFTVFSSAFAQQPVPPPPKPANDAPANAAVLKLLQVGMPESVVLDKIRAITDKFDTSIDALVVLKQAGATEAELKAIMAQDSVPPQPAAQPPAAAPVAAPADTGPSLAETMQFIQDKLNDLGTVAYVVYFQDANDGNTWTQTFKDEFSNIVAGQSQCSISYHLKETNNGRGDPGGNAVISLRDVQGIVVMPYEQGNTESSAKNGSPNIVTTATNPPLTELQVRRPHGKENNFVFTDADLADRVAKAMLHAVELCGGGNKDKF